MKRCSLYKDIRLARSTLSVRTNIYLKLSTLQVLFYKYGLLLRSQSCVQMQCVFIPIEAASNTPENWDQDHYSVSNLILRIHLPDRWIPSSVFIDWRYIGPSPCLCIVIINIRNKYSVG
jgi:hypothetical protein